MERGLRVLGHVSRRAIVHPITLLRALFKQHKDRYRQTEIRAPDPQSRQTSVSSSDSRKRRVDRRGFMSSVVYGRQHEHDDTIDTL